MIEIKEKRCAVGGNGSNSTMNSSSDTIVSRHMNVDDRIILNVGGVKYETYRSTLTAYPDTFLGTMFQERNNSLLHPINGNEYFIDRNGYAFFYIMEFYRTGKILWHEHSPFTPIISTHSVHSKDLSASFTTSSEIYTSSLGSTHIKGISREELEEELHYFQLPIRNIWSSFSQRAAAAKIDQFVVALKEVIYQVIGEFSTQVQIDFRRNKQPPHVRIDNLTNNVSIGYQHVTRIIKPFGSVGYAILEKFGPDIEFHLKSAIPELKWELRHVDNYNWYSLQMGIEDTFDYEGIFASSCLASSKKLLQY